MSEGNPKLTAFNIVKKLECIKCDCAETVKRLNRTLSLYHIENEYVAKSFVRDVRNRLEILSHHVEEINRNLELL